MVFLLLLAGIGLAVWGTYIIYKKAVSGKKSSTENITEAENTTIISDSSFITNQNNPQITGQQLPAGNYKFVIEVADKERGLYRYGILKSYGLDIRMETRDSQNFKLFFILPAPASDTARIIDSLSVLYTPPGEKGFVEN